MFAPAFMLQFLTMSHSIVFMGSPDFAATILSALLGQYPIKGVITQPDRPAGRGKVLTSPAVKKIALEASLPILQPNRLKDPGVFEQLVAWQPDLIVVAAFGQILRKNVLDLPQFGCVNVHASLLPRWRGASPIQAAIRAGDCQTGVTIMKMDEGIDTGEILAQSTEPILPQDTTVTLTERLAANGARILLKTLPDYLAGRITPVAQEDRNATYASMIKKEESFLDLSKDAATLVNQVRAFVPWPIARTVIRGQEVLIHKASSLTQDSTKPGTEYKVNKHPALGTGDGLLVLEEIQLPGKKVISGKDYLNGISNWGTIKP